MEFTFKNMSISDNFCTSNNMYTMAGCIRNVKKLNIKKILLHFVLPPVRMQKYYNS